MSHTASFAERDQQALIFVTNIRNSQLPQSARDAARDALFALLKGLSISMGRGMIREYWRHYEEDLEGECALAVMEAMDYWNPEKGTICSALYYCLRVRFRQFFKSQEMISRSYSAIQKASQRRREGQDLGRYEPVICVSVSFAETDDPNPKYGKDLSDLADETAAFEEAVTLNVAVQQAVNSLPTHERKAVVLAFGLNGCEPHTLREAADKLGWSHEKVRLILSHAKQTLHQNLSGCA